MTDVRIRWQAGDIGGVLGVEVTLKKSETGYQYLSEQTFLLDSKTITLKPNVPSAGFNNVYPIPMLVCSSSPILDLNNDDRIKVKVWQQNVQIPLTSGYWTSNQADVVQNGRYLNPSLLEQGKEYTLYVWENGKSATDYCASDINKLTIKIVDYASMPDDMLIIAPKPSMEHIPLNIYYHWSGEGVYGNPSSGYYFDPNGLPEDRYVLTFVGIDNCQRGRKIIVIKAVEAMPVVERSSNEVATVLKEGIFRPEDVGALSVENGEVSIQKTYYDALGRPTQSIAQQASPTKKDIVSFNVYDPLGRMPIQYMPFTDGEEGKEGEWKSDVLEKQKAFYNNTAGIAHSNFAYGKVDLESSVFGRVVSVYAPGTDWVGSGNESRIKQKTNNADRIRMLKAGFGAAPRPTSPEEMAGIESEIVLNNYDAAQNDVKAKTGIEISQGFEIGEGEELALTIMELDGGVTSAMLGPNQFYPADELVATEVTDAEGRISRKYTNKSGQTVMSEAQADSLGTTFLQTYQVYDDFGRLRYIFPPMAVEQLEANGWRITNSILKLITHYTYDRRGRVVVSKVPDKGEVYTVYDILDRPVLSQDAMQRTKSPQEWNFIKYDLYGRTAISGVFKSNKGREELQLQADEGLQNPVLLYEARTGGSDWRYYTNQAFPTLFPTDEVESASYYDHYDFNEDGGADAAYIPLDEAGFSGILPAYGYRIFGKPTGSYTRLDFDGEIKWLKTYVFYDEKGRAIQSRSDNHLGGTDVSTILYDYLSRVLNTHLKHETVQTNVTQTIQVKERYEYDFLGRPLRSFQTIRKDSEAEVLEEKLSEVRYNELGQVVEKKLGNNNLQTLNFNYNIRGWLTKFNDLGNLGIGKDKDLFAFTLHYEDAANPTGSRLDGMVSSMEWETASDDVIRGYRYKYDVLGRLENAKYTGGGTDENYSEGNLSYDANGNIKTLDRFGLASAGNYGKTDQLTYNYDGNRLLSVTDAITATGIVGDFEDGDNTGSDYDYEYDLNGNLTRDRNKGIASIKYNPMDMPLVILWENGNKIEYLYDRAGNKLRSRAYEGEAQSLVRETDYVGGFVYEKNELSHMSTAEGRYLFKIEDAPSGGRTQGYEYFLTDHMGNLRVSFREGDVLTYTAGMEIENTLVENREFDNVTSVRSNPGQGRSSVYSAEIDQSVPMGIWKTLKVSKGDKVDARVFARYEGDNTQNNGSGLGVYATTQVPNLTGGPDSKAGNSAPLLMLGLTYAPNQNQNNNNDVPRAYLVGILYDTVGNPVETHRVEISAAAKVGIYEDWEELSKSIIVSQAGELQIFVANEGDIPVFFDDMEIKLSQHLISQENHYSPFGINLVGIEKAGTNRFLYNAMTEKNGDFDLDWYETPFRSYDAQIGRFHQVDKLAGMYPGITPYHFAMNNPVMANDPTGLRTASGYSDDPNAFGPDAYAFGSRGGGISVRDSWAALGLGMGSGFYGVAASIPQPPRASSRGSSVNNPNAPSAGGGSGAAAESGQGGTAPGVNGIPVDPINDPAVRFTGGFIRSPGVRKELGYWHSAGDIGGTRGSKIYATHNGKVTIGDGNTIHIVDPTNTLMTVYAHCVINVATGQDVKAGDVIGYMSDNGTESVHLHYEIQIRSFGETDNTALNLKYPLWDSFKSLEKNNENKFPGSFFNANGWRPINPLMGDDLLIIPGTAPFDPSRMVTPQMVFKYIEDTKHLTQGARNIYNRMAGYDLIKSIFFKR